MNWFRLWAFAWMVLLGTGGHWAQAQMVSRSLVARQVTTSTWYVEGESALGSAVNRNFISNACFVVTPEGVVVIDALGSPELARELLREISRVTRQKVSHVVVTHYHADHVYGLQVFEEAGATIVAHRGALEYIHSDAAAARLKASREEFFPWVDDKTRLTLASRWIDGPIVLRLGGVEIQVQPVGPAHTPEDLVVFLPSERVLFAGDLVFRGRIPFVGQANSRQWIQSLDTLLGFNARVVIPGHGPLSFSAQADMKLTRDYLGYLRETMGKAASEMEPFDQAYMATDWSKFEALPLFRVANRMNAYNTYLLMESGK